jgi:hypothetical protein
MATSGVKAAAITWSSPPSFVVTVVGHLSQTEIGPMADAGGARCLYDHSYYRILSLARSGTMFSGKGSKLIILLILLAALVVACAPTSGASTGSTAVIANSITVVGSGEAFGQPDEAKVQIGVETFNADVSQATAENEATLQAVMAALSEQGIAAEDIQTSNYNLWAEQRYGDNGPEGIAGYRVTNQVSVTIRDIDKVSDVLTAVTGAGANSIYGVSFSVADPVALEAEAREKAIANARERAESLAQLSNLTLGDVQVISEVIGQVPPLLGLGGGGGVAVDQGGATSISPGQLSYQVQVQVTYGIE